MREIGRHKKKKRKRRDSWELNSEDTKIFLRIGRYILFVSYKYKLHDCLLSIEVAQFDKI